MGINKDLFVQKLIEFLKKNNQNVSVLNYRRLGKHSIWAQISTSIYGCYNNFKTLELFSEWKNNKSIKNNVLKGNI
jgi:hypothetical protein